MQIILDTNIYLADVRMRGISFQNLFGFVRRTSSEIVLPRLVREELVARYSDKLANAIGSVQRAWKPYSDLLIDEYREFTPPSLKYQVRDLRKLLRSPIRGIRLKYVDDLAEVDLNEVIKRGIHRIRPASHEGEELRDVILWLFVLAYAKRSDEAIAFISGDRGFWNEDAPAPQMIQDVREAAVDLHLYRKIGDFVATHAPACEEIAAHSLEEMFSGQQIGELTISQARETTQEYWGGRIGPLLPGDGDIEIIESSALSGTVYKIDQKHDFVEAKFLLKLKYTQSIREAASPVFGISAGIGMVFTSEAPAPGTEVVRKSELFGIEATVFGRMEEGRLISVEVNEVKRLRNR